MAEPLDSAATELESTIAQLAADLRVTGLGQRTRAALRRNRSAQDDTFLPHAAYQDIPGPDLVRHLNATYVAGLGEADRGLQLCSADDQLLSVLQRQLVEMCQVVARLWDGPQSQVAAAFPDYDNLPVPFCPMYPNARELLRESFELPRQLETIVSRLKEVMSRTDTIAAASAQSTLLDADAVSRLSKAKLAFVTEAAARPSETYMQWAGRIAQLVNEARLTVPPALLHANNLINAAVGSLVSLAVWDCSLSEGQVLESTAWTDHLDGEDTAAEDDAEDSEQVVGFPTPPIPGGHQVRVEVDPELFVPMETAMRLRHHGRQGGIVIVKGLSFSMTRGQDAQLTLGVARLADYEHADLDEATA